MCVCVSSPQTNAFMLNMVVVQAAARHTRTKTLTASSGPFVGVRVSIVLMRYTQILV